MQPGFWDIMASYRVGTNFFVREIFDGIVAKPGGDYIHKYFMLLRGCLCARTCWLLGVIEEFLNLKFFFMG
jgi:hypothetical protein